MGKAGKKRRQRRHRNDNDPYEKTTLLTKQRSARCRQGWLNLLMQSDRPWAYLPSPALLTIFRRTDLEHRFRTIPLVCKSWKSISEHPQYWSSMIPDPDSISPEDAFIDQWHRVLIHYEIKLDEDVEAKLTHTEQQELKRVLGVSRLVTLIKKSGGGEAITSLYLSPFFARYYESRMINNTDRIVRLIADCCPNLKHISFHSIRYLTEEALLELISKCKRLELIDFDYVDCISSTVIQKLANCLPHLRGIRIQTRYSALDIAKYLPRLKLLNLAKTRVDSDELSSILSGCCELQYLNIQGSAMSNIHDYRYDPNTKRSIGDRGLVYEASTQIPDFYFDNYIYDPYTCFPDRYSDHDIYSDISNLNDFGAEEFDKQFTSFGDYAYYLHYHCRYEELYKYEWCEYQYHSLNDERSNKRISQRKKFPLTSVRDKINKFPKEVLEKKMEYERPSKEPRRRQLRVLNRRMTKLDELNSQLKPIVEDKMTYVSEV